MSEDFSTIDLDASLDDIEDLPGFAVFPTGSYLIEVVSAESKEINDHPAINIDFKLVEVLELGEVLKEDEKEPTIGDIQSNAFMLDNKYGAGRLKEFLKPIGTHLGVAKISEILAGVKGLNLIVVQKRIYDEKKDRNYPQVKKIAVA